MSGLRVNRVYSLCGCVVLVLSLLVFSNTAKADTFCVSTSAELQNALTTAASNSQDDAIQVVQGTYYGSFVYASTEPYDITIEGGYVAGCASRVVDAANTVLDAESSGSVLVLSAPGVAANFVVEGLTIQNGMAVDNPRGGGIFVSTAEGSISLSNNIISDNTSADRGGGVFVEYTGIVTMSRNVINNNVASSGGGVCIWEPKTSVTLDENEVGHNEGRGILLDHMYAESLNIINNEIHNNSGGVHISNISTVSTDSSHQGWDISRNTIRNNTGKVERGGGIYIRNQVPAHIVITIIMTDNLLNENSAGWSAADLLLDATLIASNNRILNNNCAGINVRAARGILMTNNIVVGNASSSSAEGVPLAGGATIAGFRDGTFVNNTICHNYSSIIAGGVHIYLYHQSDIARIYNNIILENTGLEGADLYLNNDGNQDYLPSIVEMFNNNFDQSAAGTYIQIPFVIDPTNLNNVDPLFVDSAHGDYHLQATSPCVDAGTNCAPELPVRDMDSQPRVMDRVVDIGAYEFGIGCGGHFDSDGDVDGADLATFATEYGRSDCDSGEPCIGDYDGDGAVNWCDFSVFVIHFGRAKCLD
jgi:hypothetical protein